MAKNTVCLWSIQVPWKESDEEGSYPDPIWCTCLSEAEKTFKSRTKELEKHRIAMAAINKTSIPHEEWLAKKDEIEDKYGGDWAMYRCVMRIHVLRTTKSGLLEALKYSGRRNSKIVKEYSDGNITVH